ncbi:MAG: hypothetical protein HQK84_10155, partial [Nitrospinae bacterium]|nr:hypothetical protein [Nitrospinota bacterium]
MRKLVISGISFFIFTLGFTTYSLANHNGDPNCPISAKGGYDKDKMSKAFNLDDKQKEEMRAVWADLSKEKNTNMAKMQNVHIDFQNALSSNTPDFIAIKALSKKMNKLKSSMHDDYIKAL